ncbi:MAG: hypothetical protein FD140_2852 [Limisphaerales bacterium]|nr:MAG: hypothetical protein FD140_2852 [Limisphaerales bacterium]
MRGFIRTPLAFAPLIRPAATFSPRFAKGEGKQSETPHVVSYLDNNRFNSRTWLMMRSSTDSAHGPGCVVLKRIAPPPS